LPPANEGIEGPTQTFSVGFYPNVTTLRSGLCYRKSVSRLSVVVTFVRPTQGFETFWQYFFIILYLIHPLTYMQNFTEIVPEEGVKRKRGSKIERCHVRVSHVLMSFLTFNLSSRALGERELQREYLRIYTKYGAISNKG